MRSAARARWAICALAIAICVPAAADRRGRSLSDCTSFDQSDKGDDAVAFTIKNSCTVPVDCSISWRVVCAPASKKRRSVHPSAMKLALEHGSTSSAEASAAVCGDDSWTIDGIEWSCQPNQE
jgi:hypothetical protein